MKAFILAAGLGTRLRPFTDEHPKALAKVDGRTLLEIQIKKLQEYGIRDVVVNVFHFADQIIDLLQVQKGFGSHIEISDERPEVLETGGGLKYATRFFEGAGNVLIQNVDILSNINYSGLLRQHTLNEADATLAVTDRVSSRALMFCNEDHTLVLCGWKNLKTGVQKPEEIPAGAFPLAFSGIQIVSEKFIEAIPQTGKFSIIDSYLSLCPVLKIQGYNHSGDHLLDVGKPENLEAANSNPLLFMKHF